MQNFPLLILGIYSRNPLRRPEDIAHRLGAPVRAVQQSRAYLIKTGYLQPEESGRLALTSGGRLRLENLDREKARESARVVKEATETVCLVLDAKPEDLSGFAVLEKGMTNDSYVFYCKGKKYIYRRAGTGSDMLVDRFREYANYLALHNRGISDVVVYHDPFSGTKISEFLQDSKGIDPHNEEHISQALNALRHLHTADITSPRDFSFEKTIDYYEEICRGAEAAFFDTYPRYKAGVLALMEKIHRMNVPQVFCHIDFVPGNCLLDKDGKVVLIDWEYSGRQDPIVDVAMFCLSAAFDEKDSDNLLINYLQREPDLMEWARFYTYMATASLMWSLWSMFKTAGGEVFLGYTDRMHLTCALYTKKAEEKFRLI